MDRFELQIVAAKKYLQVGLSVIPLKYRGVYADAQALRESGSVNIRGEPSFSSFQSKPPGEREIEIWFNSSLRDIGILGTKSLTIFDFDDSAAFKIWGSMYPEIAQNTAIQKTSKGFHVLLATEKGVSTHLFTGFTLRNTDIAKVGDVMGKGRYCTVWPSTHPNGYEYQWLEGQAPWECGILKIKEYEEAGIQILKDRGKILRFLSILLLKPRSSRNMIRRKISTFLGERTTEREQIFEETDGVKR